MANKPADQVVSEILLRQLRRLDKEMHSPDIGVDAKTQITDAMCKVAKIVLEGK